MEQLRGRRRIPEVQRSLRYCVTVTSASNLLLSAAIERKYLTNKQEWTEVGAFLVQIRGQFWGINGHTGVPV